MTYLTLKGLGHGVIFKQVKCLRVEAVEILLLLFLLLIKLFFELCEFFLTLVKLLPNVLHLLLELADLNLILSSEILDLTNENLESLGHSLVHVLLVYGEVLLSLPVSFLQLLRQLESLSLNLLGLRSDLV